MGTKEEFLTAYEACLLCYTWAADPAKLAKFMASVRATLDGASTWNHDGDAVNAAWKLVGGKGKPSLKALRALK